VLIGALQVRQGWLLAQNPLLDSIRIAFSTGPGTTELVGFIVGSILIVLLILLLARLHARRVEGDSEPAVDYLTAAVDVLGFSEADRRLLRRIAARAKLRQPAAMLLSPRNFMRAAAPMWREELDRAGRQRVEAVYRRLFDEAFRPIGDATPK
jgi:hypothetical protein